MFGGSLLITSLLPFHDYCVKPLKGSEINSDLDTVVEYNFGVNQSVTISILKLVRRFATNPRLLDISRNNI